MRKWLLPEFVEDILPPEAGAIERLRGTLLEVFRVHGYELVMPPMLEYIESLLTGTGHDLDLRTFKLIDQVSGRTMGVRSDMTPQVARIDAHLLNEAGVTRLCYAGSVLRTATSTPGDTRQVVQIGAELYGHPDIAADGEIMRLHLSALACAVQSMLNQLASLQTSEFLDASRVPQPALDPPLMTIRVWQAGPRERPSPGDPSGLGPSNPSSKPALNLRIGRHDALRKTVFAFRFA